MNYGTGVSTELVFFFFLFTFSFLIKPDKAGGDP